MGEEYICGRNITESVSLLQRDAALIAPGQHMLYYPLAVERISGDRIIDADGNEYIDFLSSASSLNLGGDEPAVIAAASQQLSMCTQYTSAYSLSRPMVEYAERLASVYPGRIPVKISFSNSGSESIDIAIRAAMAYSGRKSLICFSGAYHGSTYGAACLSELQRHPAGQRDPLLGNVHRFRYFHEDEELPDGFGFMDEIEDAFSSGLSPEDVAAVFIEPICGDGGMRPADCRFIRQLHELCQRHGILFIADEIQQGLFRAGHWFSIEDYGIVPDGIVLGKSLGAGFPLGAFIGRSRIMDSLPAPGPVFSLAGSHIACAAGAAQFDLLSSPAFQKKLRHNAGLLGSLIDELASQEPSPVRIRASGRGMSFGLQVIDRIKGEPSPDIAYRIVYRCYELGLVIISLPGAILRIQPHLNISDESLIEGFRILRQAIADAAAGLVPDTVHGNVQIWR